MPGQVILLRAATEEVLPGFMGSIQLKCNPANVDLRRLRGGQMRLLVDHDETRPVGMVTSLKAGNGEVVGEAELIETESTRSPIEDINSSLKSGLSFGFLVHKTRLLKPGESGYDEDSFNLIVERWEPYECSAVATPRGVRSKITGGLVHPPSRDAASVSTSVDAKTARPKTTTKTTKRPRTVSRRTLDSGLEREGSPAPKRPLTIPLQRDYMKEQHVAITASLASLGGSSTSPQEQEASPLAQLLTLAASPKIPQVHHKVGGLELTMDGGRGWAKIPLATAMQPAPVVRAAFDSTTPGVVGEDAGGPIRQIAEDGAVGAILGSVVQLTGLAGDALPAELTETNPLASWVAEGAVGVYPDISMTDFGDALTPKSARVSTSFSLQVAIQAGARFEVAVDAHLRRALRKLVVSGILTGTGINNQPTGITSTTGVAVEEYVTADKGKLRTFFNAEGLLVGEVDARKRWVLAPDLFQLARRTSVQPPPTNSDRRVIDRSFVAGEVPANSSDLLPTGTGVFGAWADLTLFSWDQVLVVLDKITQPGVLRVSMLAYVSVHARPGSFSILRPA